MKIPDRNCFAPPGTTKQLGRLRQSPECPIRAPHIVTSPVAVEKGTKAVISGNSSAYGERIFNNLRTNFVVEIPRKEFFNTHACHLGPSARESS
jgi:hypothetical protein